MELKIEKIINELVKDDDIINASKKYIKSKNESFWIPQAIKFRLKIFLEIACNLRTKNLLNKVSKKLNKVSKNNFFLLNEFSKHHNELS